MRRFKVHFIKGIINNIRNHEYEDDFDKKTTVRKMEEMNKYKRFLSKFKKILKLGDDYEPDNLADKKIKEWVMTFKRDRGIFSNPKQINIAGGEFDLNNIIQKMQTARDMIISEELILEQNKPKQTNRLDIENYRENLRTEEVKQTKRKINLHEDTEEEEVKIFNEPVEKIQDESRDYDDFNEDFNIAQFNQNKNDISAPRGHIMVHEHPLNITNLEDYN
jgi:hypothetical protein